MWQPPADSSRGHGFDRETALANWTVPTKASRADAVPFRRPPDASGRTAPSDASGAGGIVVSSNPFRASVRAGDCFPVGLV